MFVLLAPQKARHAAGYIVQIASRSRVELVNIDGSIAHVEVEFGPVSSVYADSIGMCDVRGRDETPDSTQKVLLLSRIKAGLEAMGGVYEIV